ncbi:MAG TPA: hypothetical protein VJO52_03080 [Gemmatimonadaceae bacterium]|nr:hypothetical protein [Gemmatimonadaceae bacterium]
MIAALVALLLAPQAVQAPAPPQGGAVSRVEMGIAVQPQVVTVGQPFRLVLRVRAPLGADIGLPVGPDSGQSVEAIDPRQLTTSTDTGVVERTGSYRLVAWDTGSQSARLGDVVITMNGRALRYAIAGDTVHVRSVLPADTARRIPKPGRDVLAAGIPWWVWVLGAVALLAVLSALWWWWHRSRGRRSEDRNLSPIVVAERAFVRLDAMALAEAGERGRFVTLNVDVARDYLAARVPGALRSLTDTELLGAVRDVTAVPIDRLAPLLAETDLIKFAHRPVTRERTGELVAEVRAIVIHIEQTLVDQAAAAAHAEKAA